MRILRGLIDVVGFLTAIPVKLSEHSLKNAAEHMYLFPLVGGFIGLVGGAIAYLTSHVFPRIVAATISLLAIFALTRFYHVDGLLDFGDGLVAHGSKVEKLRAMKDFRVGAGGLTLGLMIILLTIWAIASFPQELVVQYFTVSEVLAKFSMIVLAVFGRSAREGTNRYFVATMKGQHGCIRFLLAVVISVTIIFPLVGLKAIYAATTTILVSFFILAISNINFGGITGDVFGATNEVSRVTSFLILLAVTSN